MNILKIHLDQQERQQLFKRKVRPSLCPPHRALHSKEGFKKDIWIDTEMISGEQSGSYTHQCYQGLPS